jgi:hypothetical protein
MSALAGMARMRERKVVGVQTLPCCGAACLEATRSLFERALRPA